MAYMSAREVAELIGMSEPTVRAWCAKGRLPLPAAAPPGPGVSTTGRKAYGYWRWPRKAMRAWLRHHKLLRPARRRRKAG